MNADLTINTIVFAKSFDEKDGSERRSTARGINTADILTVKRQDATDSKTKIATKRFVTRIDREDIDATSGSKYITSMYFVVSVPALATQAQVDNVVATFKALVASTSPNYVTQVLNSES